MRRRISLVALAGVIALGLFGCGGGGYDTSSGFGGMEVFINGRYDVLSKDPGVLPGFYSLQVTQTGKTLQAIDNLGRAWTGTIGNFTKFGVYAIGEADQQQQQQQPQQPGQQQQQEVVPEAYHAEIYLATEDARGTISITGVLDSRTTITLPTADPQQQQQQTTTARYTVILGTVVDTHGGGAAGSITLYNPIGLEETQQQP